MKKLQKKKTIIIYIITIAFVIGIGLIFNKNTIKNLSKTDFSEIEKATETIYIGTAEELATFRDQVNSGTKQNVTVYLTDNIDLTDYSDWTPISLFSGIFDGNGHYISNLTIDSTSDNVGLFSGSLGLNSTIRNLGIINSSISGKNNVGGFIGYNGNQQTRIENCYITSSTISGDNSVGGIIGGDQCTIIKCYSNVSISGKEKIGGIVGDGNEVRIEYCYNKGIVTGDTYVGGIAGQQVSQNIAYCYNVGTISGTTNLGSITGKWDSQDFSINNYYEDTCIADEYAISKPSEYMKTSDFIADLGGATYWKKETYLNNGYPSLEWQTRPNMPSIEIKGDKEEESQWYKSAIEITISTNEKSGHLRYSIHDPNGGIDDYDTTQTATRTISGDGEYKVEAYVINDDGSSSELNTQTIKIDKTPPEKPLITIGGTEGTNENEYISDVQITITSQEAENNGSGKKSFDYEIKNENNVDIAWGDTIPTEPIAISGNGTYTITVTEYDNANNFTTVTRTITINTADIEGPTLQNNTIIVETPETGNYKESTEITLVATFSENIQGTVPEIKIKFGTGNERTISEGTIINNTIIYKYKIQEGDNGNLSLVSYTGGNLTDLTNNAFVVPGKIILGGNDITADTEAPMVEINAEQINTWIKAENLEEFQVVLTDNVSGISKLENGVDEFLCKWVLHDGNVPTNINDFEGGESLKSGDAPSLISQNGKWILYIYTRDNAGNEIISKSEEIWIDENAPENLRIYIEEEAEENNIYNNPVTVSVEATDDEGSGVVTLQCDVYDENKENRLSSQTHNKGDIENLENFGRNIITINQSGTYYIKLTATDAVGNSRSEWSEEIVINIPEEFFIVYNYSQDNEYISKIPEETTYEEFQENIDTNMTYTVKENDTEIEDESLIKTGQTLTVTNSAGETTTYILVVVGDINKNGEVNQVDLRLLQKYYINKVELDESQIKAGDVNLNQETNQVDLRIIKKYLINKITSLI